MSPILGPLNSHVDFSSNFWMDLFVWEIYWMGSPKLRSEKTPQIKSSQLQWLVQKMNDGKMMVLNALRILLKKITSFFGVQEIVVSVMVFLSEPFDKVCSDPLKNPTKKYMKYIKYIR